jgi:CubicO group peptidase (beta-lactamase class C family)
VDRQRERDGEPMISMRPLTRIVAPVVWLFAAATSVHAQPAARPLDGLDSYIAGAVRDWQVPGLAIAVVKNDSVVFMKGYGVRALGRPDPVDEHTLFANASTTKAFTAFTAALLSDEGRLRLDEPATTYLPGLQFADPYQTREITMRDLLSHRTGFDGSDYLWYGSTNDFAAIMRRLRWLKPSTSLRSHYAYQNVMYALAGQAESNIVGKPWGDVVRERILVPLGMRETQTGVAGLAGRANVASPHDVVSDTLRVIERYDLENVAPAGSMYSSVSDMTHWLRFLLDSARLDGKRMLRPATFAQLFTPNTLIDAPSFYPTASLTKPNYTAYGLGWFLQDYRGHRVALHTGSIDGMTAIAALVPDERIGIVVFANRDHAELRHALLYTVFDRYFGGASHDWSAEMKKMYDSIAAAGRAAERAEIAKRVPNTRPTLALDAYAGTYADSLYGTLVVRVENGTLTAEQSPWLRGNLEHWNYDTFRVRYRNRAIGDNSLQFLLDANGKVTSARLGGSAEFARVNGATKSASR